MGTNKPLEGRFWEKMKTNDNGCWEWQGSTHGYKGNEYGTVRYNGKGISTHRLAYQLKKGEIPKGMLVCHSCDNRLCCNPDHLFLGTAKDNMKDMEQKGRTKYVAAPGELNGRAKLKVNQVIEIRKLHSTGNYTVKKLAEMYGCSIHIIYQVVSRRSWKSVE